MKFSSALTTLAACVALLPTAASALPDLVTEVYDIEVVRGVSVSEGDVLEGCSDAEHGRTLVRYSMRVRNIGASDLVLGAPGCSDCSGKPEGAPCANPLFTCGPAHDHPHFASFAEASLLDSKGQRVGLGRKVGFCVYDQECKGGKYSCENQGLTAGCADVYGTGLPCQYIDITDEKLPDGQYTLELRIDPDGVLTESNESNNVATTTLELTGGPSAAIERRGYLPSAGVDSLGRPLGDMWTFQCPAGGRVRASVDTVKDERAGLSHIDPVLYVINETGTRIAIGDDQNACSVAPRCGFGCPAVQDVECGVGGIFSLVVRDHGDTGCGGPGGYVLRLEVRDGSGVPVEDRKLRLGGGARRRIPDWADATGALRYAPALDDEGVPY